MSEERQYTKLSNLVGQDFTVEKVWGYKFKQWLPETKTMKSEDTWFEGSRKVYQVVTDKGQLDLGTGQIGNLFESVQHGGKSDIIGVTFNVKSNGKTGKDIRYYLNPVRKEKPATEPENTPEDNPFDE